MEIHESAEDYLEKILILQQRNGMVRSIDIANEMGFSKPSVSIAMKKFRENGYINMDVAGVITLTDAGREIAEQIYARHQLLTKFLTAIGVEPDVAAEEACKIEHDINRDTYDKLNAWYNKTFGGQEN